MSQGYGGRPPARQGSSTSLGDILERVLDRGVVIVGDIRVNLLDIELLTIKLRLLIASVDTARELGIDWWEHDPWLSSKDRDLIEENRRLRKRLVAAEGDLGELSDRDRRELEEGRDRREELHDKPGGRVRRKEFYDEPGGRERRERRDGPRDERDDRSDHDERDERRPVEPRRRTPKRRPRGAEDEGG
ncbi:gas vesicle protein [Streptosporangium roseum]|uniref:gas vesicle protein n=1 Tax=Streptosporangium roseum TaxID=2001 RepID=UPI0012DC3B8C|nr:gas vesicle protein [Streptosporangium roseum]